MFILSVIFLSSMTLCYGDGERKQEVFPSATVVLLTGRDHVVVGSFGLWSAIVMLSYGYTAMWKRVSSATRANLIAGYINFRDPILASERKVAVKLTNFVFINNDFDLSPQFRDVFTTHLRAHISSHNFDDSTKTSSDVNEIIAREAEISGLFLPKDFTDLSMIMASVFEFKAPWTFPFERSDLTIETVGDETGQHKVVIMHKKIQVPFTSIDTIKANAIELPLGNTGKYTMLLIKPYLGVHITETLQFMKKVTPYDIMGKLYQDVMKAGLQDVNVTLPKSRITNWLVLNKPLSDIGLSEVFKSDGGHFPGISKDEIYVSSFEYEAYITFDEEGVQATSSTPGRSSNAVSPSATAATEPFVFLIIEKTTMSSLFIGLHSRANYFD